MKKTIIALSIIALSGQALAQEIIGKPANPVTVELNNQHKQMLNFDDRKAFEQNDHNLIAKFDSATAVFANAHNNSISQDDPDTINPSLWRQTQLNQAAEGLYQVQDGIYQVRGTDLTNMSFVRSDNGWIVFDPQTTYEVAKATMEFALKNMPEKHQNLPIVGMVYSHSHGDHFGGARAIYEAFPEVHIVGSANITEQLAAENIIAGNHMTRRTQYMYGMSLSRNEYGVVDGALGKGLSDGTLTYVLPHHETNLDSTFETYTIDGLEMVFMDASGTEATSESVTYFPRYKSIWAAEVVYHGMHNLYTIRGAKARDALLWSKTISQMLETWGYQAETMFAAHSAPIFGNDDIVEYLKLQRDNYGFVHNQSARLLNQGTSIKDIGWDIQDLIPDTIRDSWHTNGYHGTYSHNARGVFNYYVGYYDGNPANLNPLGTQAEAEKFVEYMGGADAIMARASADFKLGEYNFVATVLDKLIRVETDNQPARDLLADTYEQLGYLSEAAGWRNAYLSGAAELRHGKREISLKAQSPDVLANIPVQYILDFIGVKVNSLKAQQHSFRVNLVFPDIAETYVMELANGNLSNLRIDAPADNVDATLYLNNADVVRLNLGEVSLPELLADQSAKVDGDMAFLDILGQITEEFDPLFDLVPMN
ncbi:alkyl/aryl-sulfatase [Vibrio sp. WXL103]|uniref:alkyl/aryl-sulfatase n=1 Tax=Vibrio sp. WXL103 TaxID=3450710 RepID=UPI003EC7EED7